MFPSRRLRLALCVLLSLAGRAAAVTEPAVPAMAEPPFRWVRPAGFDESLPGLGLPPLPGVSTHTLYAPLPSRAAVEEGGGGRYESLLHGTYNHHTQAVVLGDKVIVYWTNHSHDENGPGQRLLARWGTLSADRSTIDWGAPETNIVEIAPAPAPVRRRAPLEEVKDRRYVEGHLHVVDGRLRSTGKVAIYHGWTDDLKYRTPSGPVPEARYSELRNDATGHRDDMRWDVGPAFYQLWKFENGRLVPDSPLCIDRKPPSSIQLTPTRSVRLAPLLPPYRDAPTLDTLPAATRELLTKRAVSDPPAPRSPGFAPGTKHIAADGNNRLAHMAQFPRPGGDWVIVRDNLAVPGFYYASASYPEGNYPPSVPTNLPGYAMPAAGRLPDGSCWIVGNSKGRFDFFITTSRDGRVFDRTWHLVHDATRWHRGLFKPLRSGPQYPFSLLIGDALWLFYSVGKEQIAATRIPVASLVGTPRDAVRATPEEERESAALTAEIHHQMSSQ